MVAGIFPVVMSVNISKIQVTEKSFGFDEGSPDLSYGKFNSPNKCAFSGKGNQLNNQAITPSIDLTGITTVTLKFLTQYEIDSPDGGYVYISVDVGPWELLDEFEGSQPVWIEKSYDLSDLVGHNIQIGFRFHTECSGSTSEGWHVDDIVVEGDGISLYVEDFEDYEVGEKWDDWTIVEKPGLSITIIGSIEGIIDDEPYNDTIEGWGYFDRGYVDVTVHLGASIKCFFCNKLTTIITSCGLAASEVEPAVNLFSLAGGNYDVTRVVDFLD